MTATTTPNTDTALITVEYFIQHIQVQFLDELTDKAKIKALFPLIFKRNASHLMDKYADAIDFAPFFLNMDNDRQADLLTYLGIKGAKDYPEIEEKHILQLEAKHPDIVAYGKKAALYYWRMFLYYDRTLTKNQLYPMVLNVLQKTLLFFNNRGINKNVDGFENEDFNKYLQTYQGETFGNYTNWTAFWKGLNEETKKELLHHILHVYRG
jgi:hypothetical protein